MQWNVEERRAGVRAVAIQRTVAVPVFLVVALLQTDPETGWLLGLGSLVLVMNLAGAAWLLGPRWSEAPLEAMLAVDSTAIATTVALSGGADSDVRFLFTATIVATAICLPRSMLLRVAALVIVLTGGVVLLMPGDERPGTFFAAAALATALAFTVSRVGEQNTARLHGLADERRRLLAAALDAEHTARRSLAQEVHDGALQTLLAARQDLEEAAEDTPGALEAGREGVDTAIDTVRNAVHELHVGALAGQLPQALRALAVRTTEAGAVLAHAEIAAGSTRHDELLYSIARQLVADAVDRAGTTRLDVGLRCEGTDIVLEVSDDGEPSARGLGSAPGVGLATSAERVAEAGGRLDVLRPARGNHITARLPA